MLGDAVVGPGGEVVVGHSGWGGVSVHLLVAILEVTIGEKQPHFFVF